MHRGSTSEILRRVERPHVGKLAQEGGNVLVSQVGKLASPGGRKPTIGLLEAICRTWLSLWCIAKWMTVENAPKSSASCIASFIQRD